MRLWARFQFHKGATSGDQVSVDGDTYECGSDFGGGNAVETAVNLAAVLGSAGFDARQDGGRVRLYFANENHTALKLVDVRGVISIPRRKY